MTIEASSAAQAALPNYSYDPEPAEIAKQSRAGKASAGKAGPSKLWGKDGFTFGDFVDLINPLQHIPVVSNIYRTITGDKLDAGARLIGGGLFGGPIGFVAAAANAAIENATGKDLGGHLLAMVSPSTGPSEGPGTAPVDETPNLRTVNIAMTESDLLEGGDTAAVPFPSGVISKIPVPTATPVIQTAALSDQADSDPKPAINRPLFAVPLPAQFAGPSKRDDLALAEFGMKPIDDPVQALMSKRAEDLSAQELVQILARYQLRNNAARPAVSNPAPQPIANNEVIKAATVKASGFFLEEFEIPTPEMKD